MPPTVLPSLHNKTFQKTQKQLPSSGKGPPVLYQQGKQQQALADIQSALSIEPNAIAALALKGDILANQTQVDLPGAITAYTQALTLEPNNIDRLNKRCKVYADGNQWDLAHSDCTQAIAINERAGNAAANQFIYYSRGTAYGEIGDPEKGLADYERFRSP